MYGLEAYSTDQVGHLDSGVATFGRSYAASPDELIEQLKADPAIAAADTLLLTIPNQLGFKENLSIISNFAKYVTPELGATKSQQGPNRRYKKRGKYNKHASFPENIKEHIKDKERSFLFPEHIPLKNDPGHLIGNRGFVSSC